MIEKLNVALKQAEEFIGILLVMFMMEELKVGSHKAEESLLF